MEEQQGKTIREWLEGFEEPYRTQALDALDSKAADEIEPSASEALLGAFIWPNITANGDQDYDPDEDYWANYHHVLLEREGIIKYSK